MVVCSEGSEKEIVLEEFLEKKSLSLAKVLVGGIKWYLYAYKLRFSGLFRWFWMFFRVEGPGPIKKGSLGPKNWCSEVLEMSMHTYARSMRAHT